MNLEKRREYMRLWYQLHKAEIRARAGMAESKAARRARYREKAPQPTTEHGKKIRKYYDSTPYEERLEMQAARKAREDIREEIAKAQGLDMDNSHNVFLLNERMKYFYEMPCGDTQVEYDDVICAN